MISKRPAAKTDPGACDAARPLLQAWLDGELAPSEVARLQSHLTACEACGREARELQSLAGLLRKELNPEMPLPAGAAVVGRILEQSARRSRRPAIGALAIPALAVLVVAMMLVPRFLTSLPHPVAEPGPKAVIAVETAHAPQLVVLDDERLGRQVLLTPAVSPNRPEEGQYP